MGRRFAIGWTDGPFVPIVLCIAYFFPKVSSTMNAFAPLSTTGSRPRARLPGWAGTALIVTACIGVEVGGGLATYPAIDSGWYDTLRRPAWNPPNGVFGPVWTLMFLTMAVAACLVWHRRGRSSVGLGLTLFAAQLVANLAWSALFFWMRSPTAALIDIGLLWILLGLTTLAFFRVSRLAGWLLVPYLAWVSFAAVLNAEIVRLNP